MEKDTKIILGSILILLVTMISFKVTGINQISGEAVKIGNSQCDIKLASLPPYPSSRLANPPPGVSCNDVCKLVRKTCSFGFVLTELSNPYESRSAIVDCVIQHYSGVGPGSRVTLDQKSCCCTK